MGERSWEQRFKGIQQELSHMKEVVKGRASDSMDTLVQQTESPFTAEVLHFPLPTRFKMPQIEAFDGTKDLVDHLNTYKNQMKLHGYQDPVRCRAFAITLKGPVLAWFNRLPCCRSLHLENSPSHSSPISLELEHTESRVTTYCP